MFGTDAIVPSQLLEGQEQSDITETAVGQQDNPLTGCEQRSDAVEHLPVVSKGDADAIVFASTVQANGMAWPI